MIEVSSYLQHAIQACCDIYVIAHASKPPHWCYVSMTIASRDESPIVELKGMNFRRKELSSSPAQLALLFVFDVESEETNPFSIQEAHDLTSDKRGSANK